MCNKINMKLNFYKNKIKKKLNNNYKEKIKGKNEFFGKKIFFFIFFVYFSIENK
jgi:hypothetical protein